MAAVTICRAPEGSLVGLYQVGLEGSRVSASQGPMTQSPSVRHVAGSPNRRLQWDA